MSGEAFAALFTPAGSGGIGVIVVTGPDARKVVERVLDPPLSSPGNLCLGRLRDPRSGEEIDEVLVRELFAGELPLGSPGPAFEIDGHGGYAVSRRTLQILESAGARLVGADELVLRQARGAGMAPVTAWALHQLPRARTRRAARVLFAQAHGALERAIRVGNDVERLLATAPFGCALVTPPQIALAGGTNVGKSTLLNALLGRERVLVDAHPGTTRDVILATVVLRSVAFELADMAGIRESPEQEVESLGMDRAHEFARSADQVLFLVDSTRPLSPMELDWLEELESLPDGPRIVRVASKCDLPVSCPPDEFLPISGLMGTGLDRLEQKILEPFAADLDAPADRPVVFDRWIEEALREGDTERLLGGAI